MRRALKPALLATIPVMTGYVVLGFGFGLVLLVKEGMRAPLDALFAGHMASRAVRYFLTVAVAGLVWPLTFRWFGNLGKKN